MNDATNGGAIAAFLPQQRGLPSDLIAFGNASTRWVNLALVGGLPRLTHRIGKEIAYPLRLSFLLPLAAWAMHAQELRVAV